MRAKQGIMRAIAYWVILVAEAAGSSTDSDETCLLQSSVHQARTHPVRQKSPSAADVSADVFLSSSNPPIPCHIHQTWKTSKWDELPDWVKKSVTSFRDKNPGCNHTLWSDADMNSFIETRYPQLQEAWNALKPVQRADLFRYAVIHQFGGYYSDADVECMKPIKDWGVPEGVELAVGYETGYHLKEKQRKQLLFARPEQFEQWTFGAKAGHPALKRCLELFQRKRSWGVEQTVELTGPALFSDAVHEFLWRFGRPAHHKAGDETPLNYPSGHGPDGSQTWIFTANQVAAPGATAGNPSPAIQLVQHHFQGSWKSKNGKESSPAVSWDQR